MAAVSAALGRPFMPHQRYVVDVALEVQSEAAGDPAPGDWAYDDNGLSIQRRGGKTSLIVPVTAHRAETLDRAVIQMTAQKREKARQRWMEATDDILRSVLRDDVRRKIGRMGEELKWKRTGSLFVPFAPKEDETHGDTLDLIWIDELWAFDAEQRQMIQAGYVPAFATTNGQAWKMSTAGTSRSSWLNDARDAGRAAVKSGVRLGSAWFEWGLPDEPVPGRGIDDLSDVELVQACIDWHPAVCHLPGCPGPRGRRPCPHGFTVRPAALRSAWTELGQSRAEFLRAYGNRSADDVAKQWRAVAESTWLGANDDAAIPENARVSLGVAVDPDSEDAAVSAGWRDAGGRMHVELVTDGRRLGTRWLPGFVAARVERNAPGCVAITNVGPGRDIADQLEAAGVPVLRVSQADFAAACVRHSDELQAGTWRHAHSGEGYDSARDAVAGPGRVWVKDAGVPASVVQSHALAGWAFDHAPAAVSNKFWMG